MTRLPAVSELLERYMEDSGLPEQSITAQDICTRFRLVVSRGLAISGFFWKIYHGPFFSFPLKVIRIEKLRDTVPPYRIIKQYPARKRPAGELRDATDPVPTQQHIPVKMLNQPEQYMDQGECNGSE